MSEATVAVERDHLSATALQMHQRCPKQYEFRYIEKLIIPPGVAQIRGRSFHQGVAHNFRQKIETRSDLPVDEIQEATADSVDAEFAGELFLLPEERSAGLSYLKGRTKDEAVSMVCLHSKEIAPAVQPILVERRITLKPDKDKFPAEIVGYLDLVDEQDFIRDNKTSKKTPPKTAAETSQQLTIYALLFRALTGRKERGVSLDTVIRTEAGNMSVNIQESKRDSADIEILKKRMGISLASIKTGIFPPTNPDNWWCSEKWCGYWDGICPFGRKTGGTQ